MVFIFFGWVLEATITPVNQSVTNHFPIVVVARIVKASKIKDC
ncbi:MAG TPA: hypothetical protein VFZ46_05055 [Nitrososphaeraceae archaeon]